ncbi:MAG: transglycosylase SLT domain-containing protein [Treponema sp.]|nr:transglycosylase SLT domain-containing protein [Treponema sp.]
MNLYKEKIEALIPLFTGLLCSMVLCSFIASHNPVYIESAVTDVTATNETEAEQAQEPDNFNIFVSANDDDFNLFMAVNKVDDAVLTYYRDPVYREWVVGFFTDICSSREIAQAVLDGADEYNVPPALAFALSWEESKFNPLAVNRHNYDGSVDRGLFQLNNRSFPNMELIQFFNIKDNARNGVGHLRFCLNTGGSEVSALAMYNAGTGRISNTGAPKVTLDYISRILENRSRIENRFHFMLIREEENRLTENQPIENQPADNHFAENSGVNIPLPQSQKQSQFSRTLISASPL